VSLALDPANPRRLLCFAYYRSTNPKYESRGGLFRSVDRGATWNELPWSDPVHNVVSSIVFDPHRPGHVLLGADDGLWRSDDHGDSWHRDDEPAPSRPVWQVKMHPFAEDVLLIAAGNQPSRGMSAGAVSTAAASDQTVAEPVELARSPGRVPGWFQFYDPDEGDWVSIEVDEPQTAAAFAPRDWRRMWIAANRRLFRSDDAGRTFTSLGMLGNVHVRDIACDPSDSDRLVAGTDEAIYWSSDAGATFRASWSGGVARQLVVEGPAWIAATASGPMRSRDRGEHWEPFGEGFPEQRCWSIGLAPDGARFAGADGLGIDRLDPGSDAWLARSVGLPRLPMLRPARLSATAWMTTSELGVHTTRDGGLTWDLAGPGGTSSAAVDEGFRQMAVGTRDGEVRLTKDGGRTWRTTRPGRGAIFWLHTHEGGLWARAESGWLGRLEPDFSWAEDGPFEPADTAATSDPPGRARLADVVLPGGAWLAIDADGRLYRRADPTETWETQANAPSALALASGTWRLAPTAAGWFAWKYEGDLVHSPQLGRPWKAVTTPEGVQAIGGLCGDPRGTAAVWVAALDGTLFRVDRIESAFTWKQVGAAWPSGACGFLDPITQPPSVLGSGTGGCYLFSAREPVGRDNGAGE
jgi:hypothetical protein